MNFRKQIDTIDFATQDPIAFDTYLNSAENKITTPATNLDIEQIKAYHNASDFNLFTLNTNSNSVFSDRIFHENDFVMYDELIDPMIIDQIKSSAIHYNDYEHNNVEEIQNLLTQKIYKSCLIITANIFPLDGDSPNLEELFTLIQPFKAKIIIDITNTIGVSDLHLEQKLFESQKNNKLLGTIINYKKLAKIQAIGFLHESPNLTTLKTNLTSQDIIKLNDYYSYLANSIDQTKKLRNNIITFNQLKNLYGLKPLFVHSKSAIQTAILPSQTKVINVQHQLSQQGFLTNCILAPSVKTDQERLQIHLKSTHTEKQLSDLLKTLTHILFTT